jgi:hypothetical protein
MLVPNTALASMAPINSSSGYSEKPTSPQRAGYSARVEMSPAEVRAQARIRNLGSGGATVQPGPRADVVRYVILSDEDGNEYVVRDSVPFLGP